MSRFDDDTVSWSLLPLGLAILMLTVLHVPGATAWWQIATVVVMSVVSLVLITRGAMSAARLIQRRRSGS